MAPRIPWPPTQPAGMALAFDGRRFNRAGLEADLW
eukprot:gene12392-10657_t